MLGGTLAALRERDSVARELHLHAPQSRGRATPIYGST